MVYRLGGGRLKEGSDWLAHITSLAPSVYKMYSSHLLSQKIKKNVKKNVVEHVMLESAGNGAVL